MKNFDRYYDPPEEDEIEYCEECGEELEIADNEDELVCKNVYCPGRLSGLTKYAGTYVIQMAKHLAEVEQSLRETKTKLKYSVNREEYYKKQIDKVTQSQNSLRDTNYQIRRMNDIIECVSPFLPTEVDVQLAQEWIEVRKILE